ncbi:unnamed protein product [Heterobilharzia americana]|nr:unnamed protein product [Heterobilharzia americana]
MSLSWPCYLKDCVSPKWKSEEHCAEFWNGTSKSYGFKFLTYGEFQKYSDELVEFFKRHLVFEPNENKTPVVAVVWAPHILTSVVIHGIVKSGFPFFPILHATASFDLVTLQIILMSLLYFVTPLELLLSMVS